MIPRSDLLVVVAFVLPLHAIGQDDVPGIDDPGSTRMALTKHPTHGLKLSFGVCAAGQSRFDHLSGPEYAIEVPFRVYPRFALDYGYRFDERASFSIGLGLGSTPYSCLVTLPTLSDSLGDPLYAQGEYPLFGHILDRVEISGSFGWTALSFQRWDLSVSIGARTTLLTNTAMGISASWEDLGDPTFVEMEGNYSTSPQIGATLGAWFEYEIKKNLNRIVIGAEAYYLPSIIYHGTYELAPDAAAPSRGTVEVPGTYLSFSLGYVFTWGPPKELRWKRKARQ